MWSGLRVFLVSKKESEKEVARPRAKGLSWLLRSGKIGRMLAKGQRGRKRTTVLMAKLRDEEAIRFSRHLTTKQL